MSQLGTILKRHNWEYLKLSQRVGRQTNSTTGNHLKMSQRVDRQGLGTILFRLVWKQYGNHFNIETVWKPL